MTPFAKQSNPAGRKMCDKAEPSSDLLGRFSPFSLSFEHYTWLLESACNKNLMHEHASKFHASETQTTFLSEDPASSINPESNLPPPGLRIKHHARILNQPATSNISYDKHSPPNPPCPRPVIHLIKPIPCLRAINTILLPVGSIILQGSKPVLRVPRLC